MQHDVDILEHLLEELGKITPDNDLKLQTLKGIIEEKLKNPVNEGNKELLIFSAFADTANYLYEHIAKWIKDKYGLETAMIEGSQNKVTLKHCPKTTNHLLTMFSPISKNRDKVFGWMPDRIQSYNDPKLRWSPKVDKHEFDDCFKDIVRADESCRNDQERESEGINGRRNEGTCRIFREVREARQYGGRINKRTNRHRS